MPAVIIPSTHAAALLACTSTNKAKTPLDGAALIVPPTGPAVWEAADGAIALRLAVESTDAPLPLLDPGTYLLSAADLAAAAKRAKFGDLREVKVALDDDRHWPDVSAAVYQHGTGGTFGMQGHYFGVIHKVGRYLGVRWWIVYGAEEVWDTICFRPEDSYAGPAVAVYLAQARWDRPAPAPPLFK